MIYLLEDDQSINDLLIYTLKSQGLEAMGFLRPSLMYAAMDSEFPDLFLLDIMLPEESGMQVLQKLRRNPNTINTPIIMLTAKDSEFDIVKALDMGADDYISKPFRMMELVSRIKANLRRSVKREEIEYKGIKLIPLSHKVLLEGEEVDLTLKEYQLLSKFMSYPNKVFTRDELLTEIWGYDYGGETRTVDVHIRSLRKKLDNPDYIRTIRGIGYKLGD